MSCRYSFEDLLALLHRDAPAKVDAVALHRRRVENGHLSVGLKIHCLDEGSQFTALVDGLGGAQKILDINYYKHSHASLCLVLPPVGNARSAILLTECIEHFTGTTLFNNPQIQIQVCSPGRLDARRSALLAIGFYLGSDTLRRYTLGQLATSFAKHQHYPRGRRLVLYDAEGDFDRSFDWWTKDPGKHCLVKPYLPFESGRTDLLTGSGSRLDIQNINLLSTLLVHAQYQGYWSELGMQFQQEIELLLEQHLLSGLIEAPWVRTGDPKSDDDDRFFAALQELKALTIACQLIRVFNCGRAPRKGESGNQPNQQGARIFHRQLASSRRELEAALRIAKPMQFKENIALVLKYFDKPSISHSANFSPPSRTPPERSSPSAIRHAARRPQRRMIWGHSRARPRLAHYD